MDWEGTYVHVWLHLGFPATAWSFFQLLGWRSLGVPGCLELHLESHRSPPGRLFLLCSSPQGCQQHQLVGWAYSLSIPWSPACSGTITPLFLDSQGCFFLVLDF